MTVPLKPSEPLPEVSWPEFAAHFAPSVHETLRRKALEPGTEGWFMIECVDLSSHHAGHCFGVQYGPFRTYQVTDLHLGRLLSPGANTLMYAMRVRVARETIEMADNQTQAAKGVTLLDGTPIDRAYDPATDVTGWPKLFKKTTSGKTQEWEIWVERTAEGHGRIHTKYGLADGKKQEQQDVVTLGKNVGKKNATTAYDQAVSEAQAEWTKQLERKGYGRDVEKSAATRAASPMLAHPFEKVKQAEIDWAAAHTQPKFDGYRCLAERRGDEIHLRSREGKPMTMPHVAAELLRLGLPQGVVLDGELYRHDPFVKASTPAPGPTADPDEFYAAQGDTVAAERFRDLASAVKKVGSPLAPQVQYHVYDALTDRPFAARYQLLRELLRGTTDAGPVRWAETVPVVNETELRAYQARCLRAGFEGCMLRHGPGGYDAGKRSKALLKVKNFQDAEFKVTDVREGRGTHKGMAIFMCVTPKGTQFEVTAPGGHHEKRQYWLNRAKCVGAQLTVKYFEMTGGADSVPRFPVGLRFKDEPFEMPAEA